MFVSVLLTAIKAVFFHQKNAANFMKKNEKKTKSNFTTLMNSLNAKEIIKFGKYLRAFYPARQITKTIYPVYENYFKSKKQILEVEIAYRKVYKKTATPKTLKIFNNELSDLYKELKSFLIQEKIKQKQFEKEYLWLEILQERNLNKLKKAQFKSLLTIENNKQNGGIWQSLRLFQLHDFAIEDLDFLETYEGVANFLLALRYLETFRLDTNLKYAIELKNREKIRHIKNTDTYFESVFDSFEKNKIGSLHTILYFKLYSFLKNEKLDDFAPVKFFLIKHHEFLDLECQKDVTIYLLNYIALQIKKGQFDWNKEAFYLYEFALKKGFLLKNGILLLGQFQNIINVACFLKKYEWANSFINIYRLYLEETIRPQFINIAYAIVLFSESKFSKIFDLIDESKLKEIRFQMLARIYLLASSYELNLDNLEEKCDTFIKFITRKKNKELGASSKSAAIKFGQILKKIVIRNITKDKLIVEIRTAEHLYFRQWLGKKMENYSAII